MTERVVPTFVKPDWHVCTIMLLLLRALATDGDSALMMMASNLQYFMLKVPAL